MVMDRIDNKVGGSQGGAFHAEATARTGCGDGVKAKKFNKLGNAKPVDTATKMK